MGKWGRSAICHGESTSHVSIIGGRWCHSKVRKKVTGKRCLSRFGSLGESIADMRWLHRIEEFWRFSRLLRSFGRYWMLWARAYPAFLDRRAQDVQLQQGSGRVLGMNRKGMRVMKRVILSIMLGGVSAAGIGCADLNTLVYRPIGSRPMCDMDHCGGRCGPGCETDCGPACGPGCGLTCEPDCGPTCGCDCGPPCEVDCGPTCGDTCGSSCGPTCGPPCCCCRQIGPIVSLLHCVLNPETWCGSSCGEKYWGDFYSDPPDCCDPCDWRGNFTPVHVEGFIDGCGCGAACSGGCSERIR